METAYFITAIVSLTGFIVSLLIHIKTLNKKHSDEKQRNIADLVSVVTKNNLVIEANTKSHDRLQDYFVSGRNKKG